MSYPKYNLGDMVIHVKGYLVDNKPYKILGLGYHNLLESWCYILEVDKCGDVLKDSTLCHGKEFLNKNCTRFQ